MQRASASPAGEQPDALLPLHVLPLYSLLAPEKQAQVTGWCRGRCLVGEPPTGSGMGAEQAPAVRVVSWVVSMWLRSIVAGPRPPGDPRPWASWPASLMGGAAGSVPTQTLS